eukprot:gene34886-46864_t
MRNWGLFAVGLVLILAGAFLAGRIQTSGGVTVTDVRFPGTGGVTMSGLLYTPKTATAATPAPGILAPRTARLKYLRSLPTVDKANIGLEGHSMGGWTVLAAAATMPDAYKAVVLEGSSTGAPFAAEGTPVWPRNM